MAEGKGAKFILGLSIAVVVMVIGFLFYQTYVGDTEIGTVFLFLLLGITAIGLVKLGISTSDTRLDLNNFIPVIILISAPIVLLFLLSKLGINLFSTFGISGSINTELNFTGSIADFIRNNLFLISVSLIALYLLRNKIVKGVKSFT